MIGKKVETKYYRKYRSSNTSKCVRADKIGNTMFMITSAG